MSLLLVLAGCTTTPRLPPASEEEQSASVAKFVACLNKNVSKVDDRVSDASTIASALLDGPCAAENAASKETYTRDMSPRERAIFESSATAPFQVALDTVVRHRAIMAKRAPGKRLPVKSQSMQ